LHGAIFFPRALMGRAMGFHASSIQQSSTLLHDNGGGGSGGAALTLAAALTGGAGAGEGSAAGAARPLGALHVPGSPGWGATA
jgi:hypothetical protein